MTPADLKAARKALGLTAAALGRALELEGKDPGRSIRLWEAGRAIPGPARVAIRYMLASNTLAAPCIPSPPASPPPTTPESLRDTLRQARDILDRFHADPALQAVLRDPEPVPHVTVTTRRRGHA